MLAGVMLVGMAAPTLHNCHHDGRTPCAVCIHAQAPACAPDAAPPMPTALRRCWLVLTSAERPRPCQPLPVFSARAPPDALP